MISVLGFLIILGPLVIVHEFGHYIFARFFGVKAEIFSIGFGPRLWSRQCGETELRVSAFPLGGYVKLLGEEPDVELSPALQKRALQNQAAWKRFFIFFGGPLFNFLFAILIFMVILVKGEPHLASVVGRTVEGSVAQHVGFQSGDKILAVNGKPVNKFDEVMMAIDDSPGKEMHFQVLHPRTSQPIEIAITPTSQDGFSVYGESTHVGEIEGLLPNARGNQVGVSNPNSPAGKAGVKTGDKIAQFNGTSLDSWEELERLFQSAPSRAVLNYKFEDGKQLSFTKPAGATSLGQAFGMYSSELFVEKTVPKSPAEVAGIKSGDHLIGIGKQDVHGFFELKDAVQRAGERDGKVLVRWERNGVEMVSMIDPTVTSGRDPALKKTHQFTVGVMPMMVWAEPPMYLERVWNPFMLVITATERMAVLSWRNLVSLRKMFSGDVSVGTLGGPILIGKIAGESLSHGLIAFLTTMAILSVGLGVLNVLPIPVLDGGHLLLLGIEAIRRKPLTMRQMEIFQQIGLSLILILMVIVIRNDLARLPLFN